MYTKEFLIEVYLDRLDDGYMDYHQRKRLKANAEAFFDKVGRDEFRKYACVTPEAIRVYLHR